MKASDYRGKTLKFTVSGKVNAAKTGKYKITYTAKDAKGSKTKKSIIITVKDTKAPSISLKRKTLTYNKAVSKEKLVSAIKADVVAKDLGKNLRQNMFSWMPEKHIRQLPLWKEEPMELIA